MKYSYRLHPQARVDLAEAYDWYENALEGLGERFIETAKNKIEQIILHPDLYGSKRKGFRETIISNDFPYIVVYRINHIKREILISSVLHDKRNPKNKYRK